MVKTRRYLHQRPETAFNEFETSKYVYDRLCALNTLDGHASDCITVADKVGRTGVVGFTYGTGPVATYPTSDSDATTQTFCVLLRADMDGLPVAEVPTERNAEYISQNEGRMHACGHDGHMAMLLTAATVITSSEYRARLPANFCVKFVFQPAEEMGGGAKYMIDDGVLEDRPRTGPRVSQVFGCHLWTYSRLGEVVAKYGALMAASDRLHIEVLGSGGHGAVPQGTRDAVVCASHLVVALQTVVARNVAPVDAAVVTIGTINGGFTANVIADKVMLTGTVRSLSRDTQVLLQERIRAVCQGIGAAFGCEIKCSYLYGYPATVSARSCVDVVADVAAGVVGAEGVARDVLPTMGAEDFAFFLNNREGCFYFIGANPDGSLSRYPHHKSSFDLHEDALPIGASVFLGIVEKLAAGMQPQ